MGSGQVILKLIITSVVDIGVVGIIMKMEKEKIMSTYKVKEVQQWDTLVKTKEGNWIPARPVNHKVRSFSEKLK